MEVQIEKISSNLRKIGAALLSIGVGVSAATGFSMLDDSGPQSQQDQVSTSNSVSTGDVVKQIDQNKNKLDAVSDSGDSGNVDYTRFGC